MKNLFASILIVTSISANACTSFGFIESNLVVLAKNRDYLYSPQNLQILVPNRQFYAWQDNPYTHRFKILALIVNNDVKMGTNESGLTAIEEDPVFPTHADSSRAYLQPVNGNAEGMVLWGILQNFATVNELIPYIKPIFATAAPNFYQIADDKQILNIEVAYGKDNKAKIRSYNYKLLTKPQQQFTHTNYYLTPQFASLNNLSTNKAALLGAKARNARIQQILNQTNLTNESAISNLLLDTKSSQSKANDKWWCLNTSIFRSNLQGESQLTTDETSHKIYGTLSSWVIFNRGNVNTTTLNIRIIGSVRFIKQNEQEITYREVNSTLANLFNNNYQWLAKSFKRTISTNNICQ